MTRLLTRAAVPSLILALTVAACGQDTGDTTTSPETTAEFAFGSLADAADADRVIEIQTTDAEIRAS